MSTGLHTEQELARLLHTVEERERTARQRAFLYTLLPILVGIAFLSFTAWQVVNAERRVAVLKTQEGVLKGEKDALEQSIAVLRGQVDTYAKILNQVTTDVKQYGGAQLQKTVQQATSITTEVKLQASKTAVPGNFNPNGAQIYDFKLWVDASRETLARISSVRYEFNHPTFPPKLRVQESSNRDDGFPVSYRGWGCLSSVIVTFNIAEPKGPPPKIDFDMCAALRW
jgi:cell division protein FtsB